MGAKITTILFDVGGVLGTNGWDGAARAKAVERFALDGDDFESRHAQVVDEFETGGLSLDDYLAFTVFHQSRRFDRETFRAFMFERSQPHPEALALVESLARSGGYLMGTLNNESLELNRHRIETFGLRRFFTVFFSSAFLGVRKPGAEIFRRALWIIQRQPQECLYTDDRSENVEAARNFGVQAIRYEDVPQLRHAFADFGVET